MTYLEFKARHCVDTTKEGQSTLIDIQISGIKMGEESQRLLKLFGLGQMYYSSKDDFDDEYMSMCNTRGHSRITVVPKIHGVKHYVYPEVKIFLDMIIEEYDDKFNRNIEDVDIYKIFGMEKDK